MIESLPNLPNNCPKIGRQQQLQNQQTTTKPTFWSIRDQSGLTMHWVPSRGRSESAALGVCVYIKSLYTHTVRHTQIHFGRETVPSVTMCHQALVYCRATITTIDRQSANAKPPPPPIQPRPILNLCTLPGGEREFCTFRLWP